MFPLYIKIAVWALATGVILLFAADLGLKGRRTLIATGWSLVGLSLLAGLWFIGGSVFKAPAAEPTSTTVTPTNLLVLIGVVAWMTAVTYLPRKWKGAIIVATVVAIAVAATIA